MERLVKDAIEGRLNELVRSGTATRAQWITDAELDARLFEIPGIDLQACGGTHVANTAEIGLLKIIKIRSQGKRNKRVTLELA